jgi:hypothetical protein
MHVDALILRPGKNQERKAIFFPKSEPSLDDLRAVILPMLDGAELEHVSVLADFDYETGLTSIKVNYQPLDMFVDEEGAIRGLPRNDRATRIYRHASVERMDISQRPELVAMMPVIYGPAVLFNRRIWF